MHKNPLCNWLKINARVKSSFDTCHFVIRHVSPHNLTRAKLQAGLNSVRSRIKDVISYAYMQKICSTIK